MTTKEKMWYLRQLRLSSHRPGSLNSRYLFSHRFGAWKSETRVPAWWSSGKGSLLCFQTACCLLTVLKWQRERAFPLPLKALVPPWGGWGPALLTSSKPVSVCVLSCVQLLWPHGLLCPWDFPDEDTAVGCHFLLQRSSQTRNQTHVSWVSCIGEQGLPQVPAGKPI